MQIIDTHIHLSLIPSFLAHAAANGIDFSPSGYVRECAENHVRGVVMGIAEFTFAREKQDDTPALMTYDRPLFGPQPYAVGINPLRFDEQAARELEKLIQTDKNVVGLKIYGGYFHYYLNDPVYGPAFELASAYKLPVVFHSGDTFSDSAILKYAHPLIADEVAKTYRSVDLVLAHMGNPWIFDAAEAAYRNDNVFVDISGLYVGANLRRVREDEDVLRFHRLGLKLIHNYEKVLYGSDWPLSGMGEYIEFIQRLVPEEHWPEVFCNNAQRVFGLR